MFAFSPYCVIFMKVTIKDLILFHAYVCRMYLCSTGH